MQSLKALPLTILLAGITAASAAAAMVSITHHVATATFIHPTLLLGAGLFVGLLSSLWYLVWLGRHQITAYIIVAVAWLLATYLVGVWSIQPTGAAHIYILAILLAGSLIGARAAITVTAITVLTGIAFLSADDLLEFDTIIGLVAVIGLVGLVSWLSNRETRTALIRARASEAALKTERNNLELMVVERTLELQRYAEIGRHSAALLHDLVSPLTAATLNLQLLNENRPSALARQASRSITCLERYVMAARRQLQQEGQIRIFAVSAELKQVLNILSHRAKTARVVITVDTQRVRLYGDPVKFNHLATNLIANAIDAYDGLDLPPNQANVGVSVEQRADAVILRVTDHGSGIVGSAIDSVFRPFFSTKTANERGTGLGLSIAKRICEDDFSGSLDVTSSVASGTIFTARLNSARTKKNLIK